MTQRPDRPPLGIIPHAEFIKDVDSAQFEAYRADPRIRVRSASDFQEMQAHVKDLYDGVTVRHSFADTSGHVFDCIPIEQQPSLRNAFSTTLPKAPDLSTSVPPGHAPRPVSQALAPQLDARRKDRHGNSMGCPPGTIPMRRLTLDQLGRYETLQDFFRKSPPTAALDVRPSTPNAADEGQNHRYATTLQTVDNVGGHSVLSICQPVVATPDQRMSLSQQWYTAGSGAALQTAEVGWQVLPDKYGHAQPVLFIFWTPDAYASGNYNLDAAAFVQTNPAWAIGGALGPVSVDGGAQFEIEVAFCLAAGNWWLYLGGTTSADAVGYYPTAIYNGGAMSANASDVSYGGETVCHAIGWGDMGTGQFASAGWQHAAYQRDIYYYPSAGGSSAANLTAQEPSPGCYTVNLGSAPDPWNVYFFFGGTGGTDC